MPQDVFFLFAEQVEQGFGAKRYSSLPIADDGRIAKPFERILKDGSLVPDLIEDLLQPRQGRQGIGSVRQTPIFGKGLKPMVESRSALSLKGPDSDGKGHRQTSRQAKGNPAPDMEGYGEEQAKDNGQCNGHWTIPLGPPLSLLWNMVGNDGKGLCHQSHEYVVFQEKAITAEKSGNKNAKMSHGCG